MAGLVASSGLALTGQSFANKPKYGGRLKIACNGASSTSTLDPLRFNDNWIFLLASTVFNTLNHMKGDKLVSELATSWEMSKDKMSWIVDLRQGVLWHDGSEFTADDAVFSLKRHIDPSMGSVLSGPLALWKDVIKLGKYQIKIILTAPDFELPYVLHTPVLSMIKKGTTDWIHPVGTGAYAIKKHIPGVVFSAEKHRTYFKKDAGYFDAVRYIGMNDDTGRINALLSGTVDIIREVPFELAGRVNRHSRYSIVRSDVGQYMINDMSVNYGWTKDHNARMAVKYATEREKIVNIVLNGYGSVGNDQPIYRTNPLFNADLQQRVFDADKAQYYWKKTGIGTNSVKIHTGKVYAGAIKHCLVLQQSFAKAGINLEIVRHSNDGFWSNIWGKKNFVTCLLYTSPSPRDS